MRPAYPSKRELQQLIAEHRRDTDLKPFSPAFRREGNELITFHRLHRSENQLACVINQSRATSARLDQWTKNVLDRHPIVTSLLNMSLQKHLGRLGLIYHREKRRYSFAPEQDGFERKVKWRSEGGPGPWRLGSSMPKARREVGATPPPASG